MKTTSYAAGVPASAQVKAKSDLVASPDGNWLLYIGVDSYIHGFKIIDVWNYSYFSLNAEMVTLADVRASSSLTFADNTHFFYIGYMSGSGNLVNGFIMDWSTFTLSPCNPTLLALVNHGETGQLPAAGALAFDPGTNRLYYRTTLGLLAYYQGNASLSDFYYFPCPYNPSLSIQHLTIVGNLAIYGNLIYFVCFYTGDGSNFINCIVDDGSPTWSSFSPSFDAVNLPIASQVRSDTSGFIAVSPDGSIIAYFGNNTEKSLFYFEYTGSVCTYNEFPNVPTAVPWILGTANSLTFINDNDLFYIRNLLVNHYKYEEAFCENAIFGLYP